MFQRRHNTWLLTFCVMRVHHFAAVFRRARGVTSFQYNTILYNHPLPPSSFLLRHSSSSCSSRTTISRRRAPVTSLISSSNGRCCRRSFRSTSNIVLRDTELDDQGRRIRRRSGGGGGSSSSSFGWGDDDDDNDNDNYNQQDSSSSSSWDDFDPFSDTSPPSSSSPSRSRSSSRSRSRDEYGNYPPRKSRDDRNRRSGGSQQQRGGGGGRPNYNSRGQANRKAAEERKINMKALEGAGFVHLYGITPVRNALETNRRDFTRPEDRIDMDLLDEKSYQHERKQRDRKPEAQFSPWLLVQEQKGRQGRSTDKSMQVEEVLELAQERGIPVATVDKGVLNTLSGNRPHQGMVLRCGRLDFEPLSRIPLPSTTEEEEDGQDGTAPTPNLWLVLDEVVDPQNLGALLRSVYFLGGLHEIGVLVCAKNSAPPSPTVSAASAGALEALPVYSTTNLPRTLADAERDAFRVIGASSSAVGGNDVPVYDLQDLPASDEPTLLVLGSEGHGLRNLVARSCTSFVRIPGSSAEEGKVDSLNVSVTGGILLWHFLQQYGKTS